MTIELGWWLLPLTITLISVGYIIYEARKPADDVVIAIIESVGAIVSIAFVVIISLISWLVWALLT